MLAMPTESDFSSKRSLVMSKAEASLFTKHGSKIPQRYTACSLPLRLPISGFFGWAKRRETTRSIAHDYSEKTDVIGVVSALGLNSCMNGREPTVKGFRSASYWILELSKNFLQLNMYGDEFFDSTKAHQNSTKNIPLPEKKMSILHNSKTTKVRLLRKDSTHEYFFYAHSSRMQHDRRAL